MGDTLPEAAMWRWLRKKLDDQGGWYYIKHHEMLLSGVPDISLHRKGITTWHELKVDRGEVKMRDVQRVAIAKMALYTPTYYLIFTDRKDVLGKRTFIINGRNFDPQTYFRTQPSKPGHDYEAILSFFKKLHKLEEAEPNGNDK